MNYLLCALQLTLTCIGEKIQRQIWAEKTNKKAREQ